MAITESWRCSISSSRRGELSGARVREKPTLAAPAASAWASDQ